MTLLFTLLTYCLAQAPPDQAALVATLERLIAMKSPRSTADLDLILRHLHDTNSLSASDALVPAARRQLSMIARDQPELLRDYLRTRTSSPAQLADLLLAWSGAAALLHEYGLLGGDEIPLAFAGLALERERRDLAKRLTAIGIDHPACAHHLEPTVP